MEKAAKVPIIERNYHFFDDGKLQNNRHYIAECTTILTLEEAKACSWFFRDYEINFYKEWKNLLRDFSDLYNKNTDYFVGCTIPGYSTQTVWFARSIDNEWLALDIHFDLISGILDIDKKLYKKGIELFGKDYYEELL